MEVEAFDAGFLAGIQAQQGESAAVGATIAYIVPQKDDVPRVRQVLALRATKGSAPLERPPVAESQAEKQAAAAENSAADAAALTHQTKGPRASGGGDGRAAEEAARVAAASWIAPSVDQTSSEQPLPGVSHEELQKALRHRLGKNAPAAAEALEDPQLVETTRTRIFPQRTKNGKRTSLLAHCASPTSLQGGKCESESASECLTAWSPLQNLGAPLPANEVPTPPSHCARRLSLSHVSRLRSARQKKRQCKWNKRLFNKSPQSRE